MSLDDAAVRERVLHLEACLEELEDQSGPVLRDAIEDALASLLELYGEGLERVMRHAVATGGDAARRALVSDEWVAQLLLLHGLHPEDTEERVKRALDDVRPALHAHGGDVDLLAIDSREVRVELRGTCGGCPSSSQTLRDLIETAVRAAAPEIEHVEALGTSRRSDGERRGTLLTIDDAREGRATAHGGS